MAEYIDKQALNEYINKRLNNSVIKGWIKSIINKIPTADVAEVVRCKDCKYFEVYYPIKEKDKEPIKAHYCKLYNSDRKQIDFCSYGERKEENK